MVRLLVSNGADVNKHASDEFLYSNKDLYFGGTVVGFAACLGNMAIVDCVPAAAAPLIGHH